MNVRNALNIEDLRKMARARLPKMVFDYIDGGADDEVTLDANQKRLQDLRLNWNVLVDIANLDLKTNVLGADMALPFFISPTAASRLFHQDGEIGVARAADKAGIAYSLSTIGSTRLEEVVLATSGPKFFQIYVWKDRGLVRDVMARAKEAGFTAIILTVDVSVAGNRERDPRNGFAIPPKVNWQTATQTLVKPAWLWDLISNPKITPANFDHVASDARGGIMAFINEQFDRSVTWKDAAWMAEIWDGPFAIKGVGTPEDARQCIDHGASAVWVSNHGGRQLDGASATIDLLGPIVDAVADRAEVIFDGGIRRGTDIAKALALGATACALGRAYLWGLAAGGQSGVEAALNIMESELRRTLALMGVSSISQLNADHVVKIGEG